MTEAFMIYGAWNQDIVSSLSSKIEQSYKNARPKAKLMYRNSQIIHCCWNVEQDM